MASLRIWFRRHVRDLLRTTENNNGKRLPQNNRRISTSSVPLKSTSPTPIQGVSNTSVSVPFKIPAYKPRPRPQSLPLLNFNGPDLSEILRQSSTGFAIPYLKDVSIKHEGHFVDNQAPLPTGNQTPTRM